MALNWRKGTGRTPVVEVILAPVAAFAARREDLALEELRSLWQGRSEARSDVSELWVPPGVAASLESILGVRNGDGAPVSEVAAGDLVDRLWSNQEAVAVVPFQWLEPRWKVLTLDGLSILDRDLDTGRYPLVAQVWASGPRAPLQALAARIEGGGWIRTAIQNG